MKKFNYSLVLLLSASISLSSVTYAQDKVETDTFNNLKYHKSIELLTKKVKKGKAKNDDFIKLAESYYQNGEYKHAVRFFEKVNQEYTSFTDELKHHYALSLKFIKKYKAADEIMTQLSPEYANLYLENKNYLETIKKQSGKYTVTPMPFNTEYSEFSSGIIGDQLIFASSRKDLSKSDKTHNWTGDCFLDLYQVSVSDKDNIDVKHLDDIINSKYHESSAIYTKDRLTMYFTRNNVKNNTLKTDDDGLNRLTLLKAKRESIHSSWGNIEVLPFNSNDYSVAHPALSPDDKTLYFVSDMPGSLGKSDIYKVDILEDGYGTPFNLKEINTVGRETFPHMCPGGKLFFSSDGHQGLGGLDVFLYDNNKLINMGSPINSSGDDFGFVQSPDGLTGYLSSNREGGMGKDDIYAFERIVEQIPSEFIVKVIDKLSKAEIEGATIAYNEIEGEKAVLTPQNGTVNLEIEEGISSLDFSVEKENYQPHERTYEWNAELQKIEIVVELMPSFIKEHGNQYIFDIEPVFYDLDKYSLRTESIETLDRLIAIMKVYKDLVVEVQSHTDSRASQEYNHELSQHRSNSVIQYLLDSDIEKERFVVFNFGEENLVNECDDKNNCAEDLHQSNRRTEFFVVTELSAL